MLDIDTHENSPRSRVIRLRPPRIALALLCFAALLHWSVPSSRIPLFSNTAIAAGLSVAGFALMIRAWWLFRQAGTAVCPTEKSSRMVTGGPYAWTRNPMYLGMIAMLLGVSFFLGTLPFFCATAAYGLVINSVFCPYEEQKLECEFGEHYLRYKRQVRRWL